MSGGKFQYEQYKLDMIADTIQEAIDNNGKPRGDPYYPDDRHPFFEDATIVRFKEAVKALAIAKAYAHRIDWLLSGDDGEDKFHTRLSDDLEALEEGWK